MASTQCAGIYMWWHNMRTTSLVTNLNNMECHVMWCALIQSLMNFKCSTDQMWQKVSNLSHLLATVWTAVHFGFSLYHSKHLFCNREGMWAIPCMYIHYYVTHPQAQEYTDLHRSLLCLRPVLHWTRPAITVHLHVHVHVVSTCTNAWHQVHYALPDAMHYTGV